MDLSSRIDAMVTEALSFDALRETRTPGGAEMKRKVAPLESDAQKIAREFETVFLTTFVEDMLKTGEIKTYGGGHSEEMWRSFLARAYAEEMAAAGGLGLSASISAGLEQAGRAYGGGRKP